MWDESPKRFVRLSEQALALDRDGSVPQIRDVWFALVLSAGRYGEMFEHAPDDWVYTDEILQGMESGDLSEVPRDHISAEMWMLVGEPDSAAANLLETVTEDPHVSPVFLFEPTFDSIRDHPTFLEALSVLNLEGRTPQRTPR